MKALHSILRRTDRHWVGDGFPVRTLFSYPRLGPVLSPFLMLDYAGPMEFPPTDGRRGVGEHPHRGFETVTIVYAGEVEHRDSSGGGGRIGPGDVQWMTAASGLVHEEFHSREFSSRGGLLEAVQLWVNLPARHKMAPAGYQSIVDADIPRVALADGRGSVRVIAGEFGAAKGPAKTFTPMHVLDFQLSAGKTVLPAPEGFNAALVVMHGAARCSESEIARDAEVALFNRDGSGIELECETDTTALLLCGEPIEEPIAGYGPFVMNTAEEIQQAMTDYRTGRMGRL